MASFRRHEKHILSSLHPYVSGLIPAVCLLSLLLSWLLPGTALYSTEKSRANLSPDLTGTLHLAAALPLALPHFPFTQSAPGPPSAPDPLARFSRRATLR